MVVCKLGRFVEKNALHREAGILHPPLRVLRDICIRSIQSSFPVVDGDIADGSNIGEGVESRDLSRIIGVWEQGGPRSTCWIYYNSEI